MYNTAIDSVMNSEAANQCQLAAHRYSRSMIGSVLSFCCRLFFFAIALCCCYRLSMNVTSAITNDASDIQNDVERSVLLLMLAWPARLVLGFT